MLLRVALLAWMSLLWVTILIPMKRRNSGLLYDLFFYLVSFYDCCFFFIDHAFVLWYFSDRSPSPLPVIDSSIVAQPTILSEAAQDTAPVATKASTLVVAATMSEEKNTSTAVVVMPSSTSWTDHVSVLVLAFAHVFCSCFHV
jgi:hypothetical protein